MSKLRLQTATFFQLFALVTSISGFGILAAEEVWETNVAKDKNFAVHEIRVQTTAKVSAESVWKVICDVDEWKEFMPQIKEAKVLKSNGNERIVYQRLSLPPLQIPNLFGEQKKFILKKFEDRDCTMRVLLEENPANRVFKRSWSVDNSQAPKKPNDVVRIEVNEGEWQILGSGENQSIIKCRMRAEPGGNIPAFVVNKKSPDGLRRMIEEIIARAQQLDSQH